MKKTLFTIVILLAALLPQRIMAQEPYAVLEGTTLTFYYDDQKSTRGGGLNITDRGWSSNAASITSVVFDESFAGFTTITSTAYWFNDFNNLTSITGMEYLKTDNVEYMQYMFGGCSKLTTLDVSHLNTENVKCMIAMFADCYRLESLDVSSFKTVNVTEMSGMFSGCSGLTDLKVNGFKTDNVTEMSDMFYNCSSLTSLDLSDFNTAKVTDMTNMFYGCSGLTTIFVDNGWSTEALASNFDMFTNCTSLVGGNGTAYNTDKTYATYARIDGGTANPGYFTDKREPYAVLSDGNTVLTFYYDKQKTDRGGMDIGPFSNDSERDWYDHTTDITSVVFDASFAGCTSLTSTAYWFYGFYNLASITGIEYLNTSNVTNMNSMFYRCSVLTDLDVSHFNTDNVTNMRQLFYGCSNVATLDVSHFNTANVTNMYYMFYNCSSLTSLDVRNFNTTNVTDMRRMFYYCPNLNSLDLSSFRTNNVTDMSYMFYECSSLTSLDVSNFNTDNVTDMSYMFWRCSGLTSLDLSSFSTANVTSTRGMFNGCSELTTIFVDEGWNTDAVTSSNIMFPGCTNLVGGKGTSYDADITDKTYARIDGGPKSDTPGYFTRSGDEPYQAAEPYAVLTANDDDVMTDAGTVKGKTLTFYYDGQKESREGMYLTYTPWRADETKDLITKVVFDATFADYADLTSTDSWFNECSNLATIENISNLKTENVTNMSAMFRMCTSLTSIDFENFNTSSATTLDNMFFGCSGLTSLDLSHFNTANVEDMHSMFAACTQLTTLDLSHFDTSSLTNIQGMFSGCELLETVDLSSWNTTNVTDVRFLFNSCPSLTTVYVGSNWDMSGVTEELGSYVFLNCNSIEGGKGTTYSTAHLDYTYAHIDGGPNSDTPGYLTDVADKDKVPEPYAVLTDNEDEITTDAGPIKGKTLTFYYNKAKERSGGMDVQGFGGYSGRGWNDAASTITSVVFDESFANCTTLTSTANWFFNCSNLLSFTGLENLKTDNVNYMTQMFYKCSSLTSLDVSHFNTINVNGMHLMFGNCSSLTSITFGEDNFNTSNVKDMSYMFSGCSSLTGLDMSHFNTGQVTDMSKMFLMCTALTNLDLSSFNTSNVTDMSEMFEFCSSLTSIDLSTFNTEKVTSIYRMFDGCAALTSLDLGSFNTSKVTNMYAIFRDCSNLKTIYVGDGWTTSAVTSSQYDQFDSCTKLVGGKGTYYKEDHKDLDYARIDGGKDDPGYFTRSGEDPYVAEPYAVLIENDDEISLEDTSVKGKTLTFYYDNQKQAKEGFEVGPFTSDSDRGWDSEKGYITEVEFDESFANCKTLTSTAYWFSYCSNFKKVTHIEYLVTDNVENMAAMFRGCSDLTDLDLSHFNTANVKDMSAMFHTGPQSLDLRSFDTRNVTDMSAMFYYSSVTSLDLSSFDTRNVENMNGMFIECTGLNTLDLSNFETGKVKNMASMFYRCSGLTSLNVSNFNTANVTTMKDMFKGCSHLTTLDLGSFNTENVKDMSEMFWDCNRLKTIFASEWITSALEEGKDKLMFEYSTSLVGGQGTTYSGDKTDATYARIDNLPDNPGYFTRSGDEPYKAPEAYAVLSDNNTVLTFYYNKNKGEDAFDVKSFNSKTDRGWNDVSSNIAKVVFNASFAECTTLTSTAYWFEGFSSLTTFEGSNLVTSRVTNMTAMFSGCSSLTSLDVSSFNTVNVTNMTSMFQDCSDLQTISVGRNWITKKATNGNNMFSGCTNLVGGAGTIFSSGAVDHYYAHVDGGIDNPGYFTLSADTPSKNPEPYALLSDGGKVLSIYYDDMMSSHIILNMISIDGGFMYNNIGWPSGTKQTVTTVVFDPSFADCRLKNLNSMFSGFTKLSNINGIEYLNTGEVTDMYLMFAYCYELKHINLSNFNTSNAIRMYGMFESCTSLTTLDLSSFNTSNLRDISCMFYGDNALKTIYVGSGWNTSQITNPDSLDMVFKRCEYLVGGKGTKYEESRYEYSDTDGAYARIDGSSGKPGYFTDIADKVSEPYAVLSDNNDNITIEGVAGKGKTLTFYYDTKKEINEGLDIGPFDSYPNHQSWYDQRESITQVVFTSSFADYTDLTSTAYWFYECSNLTSIIDIKNLKTDNVKNMEYMFESCSSLPILDVSGFNTGKVENMRCLFSRCESLNSLDVSSFNTANVTNMSGMFLNCESLTNLNLSGFNTANVTDMSSMFHYCTHLTSIDVSGFNTVNVKSMRTMFQQCYRLTDLDVSNFNTANVTDMCGMFNICQSLTNLDVSSFNTANVTNMSGMFGSCKGLTSLDVSHFNTSKVTSMERMFIGCSSLNSLDLSNFMTNNVEDMSIMFNNCSSLATIYVSSLWNTEAVTKSTDMFSGCTSLVGGAGTTCEDAQIMDVSYAHIDGGSADPGYFTQGTEPEPYAVLEDNDDVIYMNEDPVNGKTLTFYYDTRKADRNGMDVGPFNDFVTRGWHDAATTITSVVFDELFAGCTSLTSTAYWFYLCVNLNSFTGIENLKTDNVTNMSKMFYHCSGLTSLNVRGFNTANVTNMSEIFNFCSSIQDLDVSGFKTDNVTDMSGMFSSCSSLSSLDVSGFKTGNATDMGYMFSNCYNLANLDVRGFNTANVTNMSYMFYNCNVLANLDVSSFKTEKVTNMKWMFRDCYSVASLNLSGFNTNNVTDMNNMFKDCSNLATIYASSLWNTEAVTESTDMFSGCNSLEGGAGTTYEDAQIMDASYARIDDPDNGKPGYFTSGILGDVDGNGKLNIADAEALVSYILGTYTGTINKNLVDLNNDGDIDIFDVTLLVNMVLEDDTNDPNCSRAFSRGDNSQEEMIRLKAEANNVYLSIDEAEQFTAFQFDITLPEGVELTGVELAAGTTDHMLKFVKHRGNRYRVVGLSFTNELLATSNGQLIKLQVSNAVRGNDVSIDNVLFVTPSNKVATHIDGIEHNQQAADDNIYNLSGQKLNVKRQQLSKGVYIINHKKVIIK